MSQMQFPCPQILLYSSMSLGNEAELKCWWMDVTTAVIFNLISLGGSTNSYATVGTALTIIWPCKFHHYIKLETPSGGRTQFRESETNLWNQKTHQDWGKLSMEMMAHLNCQKMIWWLAMMMLIPVQGCCVSVYKSLAFWRNFSVILPIFSVFKSLKFSNTAALLWLSRTRHKVTILSDREKAKFTMKSSNNAQNFLILGNNKTSSSSRFSSRTLTFHNLYK